MKTAWWTEGIDQYLERRVQVPLLDHPLRGLTELRVDPRRLLSTIRVDHRAKALEWTEDTTGPSCRPILGRSTIMKRMRRDMVMQGRKARGRTVF
jgi:hypothetical protein